MRCYTKWLREKLIRISKQIDF